METLTDNGLQILDQREAELTSLANEFKGLKIAGPKDNEGYKNVRQARIRLKNERVELTKAAKELRQPAIDFQSRVIEREKQLVSIIESTEKELHEEESRYLAQVEEIRVQKEREEKARIQMRVDQLAKFNYAHDLYDLQIMSEEDFQALLGHAESDYIKIQEQIAEQKRIEEAQKAEAEQAQRLYQERLQKEREELERQKAEYEAQRKADLELAEKARKEREYIEEQNRKAREAEEAKLRGEREKLAEEKRKYEEQIRLEQAKKEAAEKARFEEQQKIAREQKEKEEAEKREQQRIARAEALKPDKEKLAEFGKMLLKIQAPAVKDHIAEEVVRIAVDNIQKVGEFLIDKSETL